MNSGSRVVDSALLRQRLRSLRQASGERQEDVASALEWSRSKFLRIEAGQVGISRADLEALLRHYAVHDESVISQLVDLARSARSQAWYDGFKIQDRAFFAYIGYESGACSIRMSQGLLIPGLLQIEGYARLVSAAYSTSAAQVEDAVRLRLARQREVFKRMPEQYHILDEAVIRRRVGNGELRAAQLRHLIEVSQRPEVTIRVIPFSSGPHFGMRGPFTLLRFDAHHDDVLYLESAGRGDLLVSSPDWEPIPDVTSSEAIARMDEIAAYQDGFNSLMKVALEPDASLEFIEQVAHDLL